ncbi:MAG: ACP S-malonyltransferase [Candidatus Sericytochromatia bacterium]
MSQAPAIVFPGQGAQRPGMGESFREDAGYRAHLARADEILGFGIGELIACGPQEELTRTEIAQPALLTVMTGIYAVWKAVGGPEPAAVAGHSLGEYAALVAAGVLEFADALELVRLRGRLMQQACDQRPGSMAAVLKPDLEAIKALCAKSAGQVVVANLNSPQQLVLSGEAEALQALLEHIREAKLGRPVALKVSGAFHSPLMEPARQELNAAIERLAFHDAAFPVVMNVRGEASRSGATIRDQLCRQLTSPVHWSDSVVTLAAYSQRFVELGPATLAPLIRQTLPEAETLTLATWPEMQAAYSI